MNRSDNSRDAEFGFPAPLFASSLMALLLLLRQELSNLGPGTRTQPSETDDEDEPSLN